MRCLNSSYERPKPGGEPKNASPDAARSRLPLDINIPSLQSPTLMQWTTRMEKAPPLPPTRHSNIWVFAPCLMGLTGLSEECLDRPKPLDPRSRNAGIS